MPLVRKIAAVAVVVVCTASSANASDLYYSDRNLKGAIRSGQVLSPLGIWDGIPCGCRYR